MFLVFVALTCGQAITTWDLEDGTDPYQPVDAEAFYAMIHLFYKGFARCQLRTTLPLPNELIQMIVDLTNVDARWVQRLVDDHPIAEYLYDRDLLYFRIPARERTLWFAELPFITTKPAAMLTLLHLTVPAFSTLINFNLPLPPYLPTPLGVFLHLDEQSLWLTGPR